MRQRKVNTVVFDQDHHLLVNLLLLSNIDRMLISSWHNENHVIVPQRNGFDRSTDFLPSLI